MVIKVNICGGIKVGGFDYVIDMSEQAHRNLLSRGNYGECSPRNKTILIDYQGSEQEISETFIHEIVEAINPIYCASSLTHEQITQLSNGLHQVIESLGIRFGIEEDKLEG